MRAKRLLLAVVGALLVAAGAWWLQSDALKKDICTDESGYWNPETRRCEPPRK
jgi:hypothetical protein